MKRQPDFVLLLALKASRVLNTLKYWLGLADINLDYFINCQLILRDIIPPPRKNDKAN